MNDNEKNRIAEERSRIIKAKIKDSMVIDPVVRVRFQNIEDPPSPGRPSPPLNFTFNQHVYKESRRADEPDTALRHGEVYDLPLSVINHLNSLSVPVYSNTTDPVTRSITSIVVGYTNRFACVSIDATKFSPSHVVDGPPMSTPRRGRKAPLKQKADQDQAPAA